MSSRSSMRISELDFFLPGGGDHRIFKHGPWDHFRSNWSHPFIVDPKMNGCSILSQGFPRGISPFSLKASLMLPGYSRFILLQNNWIDVFLLSWEREEVKHMQILDIPYLIFWYILIWMMCYNIPLICNKMSYTAYPYYRSIHCNTRVAQNRKTVSVQSILGRLWWPDQLLQGPSTLILKSHRAWRWTMLRLGGWEKWQQDVKNVKSQAMSCPDFSWFFDTLLELLLGITQK